MKKLSLVTLALSTSLMTSFAVAEAPAAAPGNPCPCPKAFSGFSFGGNLGYSFVSNTVQSTFRETVTPGGPLPTVASKANLGMQGADGGLMVGYLHRMNNWGFGLDFLANWATTKGSMASSATTPGQNTPSDTLYRSAQLKNALDLRAVFGYVISNLVMPKVMLGWENAQYSLQVQENRLTRSKDTQTAKHRCNGFLWGAGIDFLVAKNMVCGLEYTGVVFGQKTVNYDLNRTDAGAGATYKYNSSTTFKPNYTRLAVTFKFVY